jgi:AcrR family transcriptional regulator
MQTRIKAVARRQMATYGTAGLSLRAIAREMDITAPALYRYFPTLDDLITALIVDAFDGIAVYMAQADAAHMPSDDYEGRLLAAALAYRQFALDRPEEFDLVYGNAIPGYHAPPEITVPAATRSNQPIMRILLEAYRAGVYQLPFSQRVPLPDNVESYTTEVGKHFDAEGALLSAAVIGWGLMHGLATLDIHGHYLPSIGFTKEHYQTAVRVFFNCRT